MAIQKYLLIGSGKNIRDVRSDNTLACKCFAVTVLSSAEPEKGTEVGCVLAEPLHLVDAEDTFECRIPDGIAAVSVERQDPVHAAVDELLKNRLKIG